MRALACTLLRKAFKLNYTLSAYNCAAAAERKLRRSQNCAVRREQGNPRRHFWRWAQLANPRQPRTRISSLSLDASIAYTEKNEDEISSLQCKSLNATVGILPPGAKVIVKDTANWRFIQMSQDLHTHASF
jgi:hypothetical protein